MSLAVFERRQQGNQALPGNQGKLPGQRGRMQTFPLSSLPPLPQMVLWAYLLFTVGQGREVERAMERSPKRRIIKKLLVRCEVIIPNTWKGETLLGEPWCTDGCLPLSLIENLPSSIL